MNHLFSSDSSLPARAARPGAARLRGARGFTLLEIMAAVMIVAILTAASLPGISERMRDRRANERAQAISLFYRQARARALGRGAAQLVRFSTTLPQGEFLMYEAVQPLVGQGAVQNVGNCGNLPVASCFAPQWIDGDVNTRFVTSYGMNANGSFDAVFAEFHDPVTQAATAAADICFSPGGRTYYRSAANGPWAALAQVPEVLVQRYDSPAMGQTRGPQRKILIPPNGAARLIQ